MAFGSNIFGTNPLGIAAAAQSEANPARVSTSRKIDPVTQRLVQGTNGGYAGMPDAVHRVMNLTRQALAGRGALITPEDQRDAEQTIRSALATETNLDDPQIELIDVVVSDDGGDAELATITFRDLATGTVQTAKPRKAP